MVFVQVVLAHVSHSNEGLLEWRVDPVGHALEFDKGQVGELFGNEAVFPDVQDQLVGHFAAPRVVQRLGSGGQVILLRHYSEEDLVADLVLVAQGRRGTHLYLRAISVYCRGNVLLQSSFASSVDNRNSRTSSDERRGGCSLMFVDTRCLPLRLANITGSGTGGFLNGSNTGDDLDGREKRLHGWHCWGSVVCGYPSARYKTGNEASHRPANSPYLMAIQTHVL